MGERTEEKEPAPFVPRRHLPLRDKTRCRRRFSLERERLRTERARFSIERENDEDERLSAVTG